MMQSNMKYNVLFILLLSLISVNALTITITYPQSDTHVLDKDFLVNYQLTGVNTYANCTVSKGATLMYGKANLSEGNNFFLVSKDGYNFTDGYKNISISCTDLTETKNSYVMFYKSSPNDDISLYDIFLLITFISIFLSFILFFPFGMFKQIGITNPIHYGLISITIIIIISLGLNEMNWFYNRLPELYFIGILLGIGNILFSIPDYIHQSLQEAQRKKIFGDNWGGKRK